MNKHTTQPASISVALARIEKAVQMYHPFAVYGLFSGGHDSLTACKVASLHPLFAGVFHGNTGIGVEATREFVRETCAEQGWKLHEYKAIENTRADGTPDPQDYNAIVRQHGFPGPGQHGTMYVRLKHRSLARFERDLGARCPNRRVLYVSGARSQESQRRMGKAVECQVIGRTVWVNPLLDWTKLDCHRFMAAHNLRRSPVVDAIHKSGECLCGAFAEPGELEQLKFFPITRPAYNHIVALQEELKAAGLNWGWESRPPDWIKSQKAGQGFLLPPSPLCWSCGKH